MWMEDRSRDVLTMNSRVLLLCLGLMCLLFKQAFAADSPCADQIQRCGVLVEEFERQIQDVQTVAFRNCFTKTPCVQERIAFDECFGKALRSVRNTTFVSAEKFSAIAQSYQAQLEQCFRGGATTTPASVQDVISTLVDEDAVYARAIYSTEYADRLWGLVETGPIKSSLSPQEACLVKDLVTRVFGGGISRIVDSSNPQMNNLNTSCMLSTEELSCYRQSLDGDNQFQQMLQNRDRALRSCIQSIKVQTGCHKGDASRVRSCVCNAREELENRMESEILDCMRHSGVARLYTAIVDLSNGVIPANFPMPTQPEFRFKQATEPVTSFQHSEDPVSVSSTATITPGVTINGQCLCTCSQHKATPSFASDSEYTGRVLSADQVDGSTQPRGGGGSIFQSHHQQPQQGYYTSNTQQWRQPQAYYPQQQQQQQQYYQPVMSTEAGIANGFERFFSGMPPIRRRDVSYAQKAGNT